MKCESKTKETITSYKAILMAYTSQRVFILCMIENNLFNLCDGLCMCVCGGGVKSPVQTEEGQRCVVLVNLLFLRIAWFDELLWVEIMHLSCMWVRFVCMLIWFGITSDP